MKNNKPINLNQTLIDYNGKTLRPFIRLNFLLVNFTFRNVFKKTKLKDVLFNILEKPSEKSVKDMGFMATWITTQRKVQKGGIVSFLKEERALLEEIIPLRESPWFVGQLFADLGFFIGTDVKDTTELIGNLPALNKKKVSAQSLEK